MIRNLKKSELLIAKSMFIEAFFDEHYWQIFSETFFNVENCFVLEIERKIVSICYSYVIEISQIGKMSYVLAASTKKELRSKGYMKELLSALDENNKKEGIIGSVLIPESEDLFKYYESIGYNNFSYVEYRKIKNPYDEKLPFTYDSLENDDYITFLTEHDYKMINEYYEERFIDIPHFKRSDEYLLKYMKAYIEYGGSIYGMYLKNKFAGYAFYDVKSNLFTEVVSIDEDLILEAVVAFEDKIESKAIIYSSNAKERFAAMKLYSNTKIPAFYVNLLGY